MTSEEGNGKPTQASSLPHASLLTCNPFSSGFRGIATIRNFNTMLCGSKYFDDFVLPQTIVVGGKQCPMRAVREDGKEVPMQVQM